MRSNQQPLVDNSHVRQGNDSVSIGLRYIEEVTRNWIKIRTIYVSSLVSRAHNLLYRRRTSLEAILYSSVPRNLGPAFLLSSSSDLGGFFLKG